MLYSSLDPGHSHKKVVYSSNHVGTWRKTRRTFVCLSVILSFVNFFLIMAATISNDKPEVDKPEVNIVAMEKEADAEMLMREGEMLVHGGVCQEHSAAGERFPKLIHQIWTTKEVPEKWHILQKHCQAINEEYEYILWTHADIEVFIETNYPWFMETYNKYPYPVEKLDAARYFILYHYGGVYIDMDMECKVPFDEMLRNVTEQATRADIVLGATSPLGVTSSFLVAKKRHPFMNHMTRRLAESNKWYILPYWTVILSTGPLYVYTSYLSYPCREQIHILSVYLHTKVYLDHKHASTWHSWDGPIMIFFDHHGLSLLICLLFMSGLMAIIAVKTRSMRRENRQRRKSVVVYI